MVMKIFISTRGMEYSTLNIHYLKYIKTSNILYIGRYLTGFESSNMLWRIYDYFYLSRKDNDI